MPKSFDVILVTDTPEHPKWFRGSGAHRIANHLRLEGFSCLVLDFSSALNFETWKTICQLAIGSNTKLVGFSTTWWPYRSSRLKIVVDNLKDFNQVDKKSTTITNRGLTQAAVEGTLDSWIQEIKTINPKTKIVVGGPKVDFYKDIPADNFIVGFGETQIVDYLTEKNRIWPKFIDHDKNAGNSEFDFKQSQILYTDYDFIQPDDVLTVEFTRGCKFKCSFCSYPLIGRKNVVEESLKFKETIYKELTENYEKWGVTTYWVADDTFNDSTEKLRIILDVIQRLNFKPKFIAYTRLDVMHSNFEQVHLLKEIGLSKTWIGIDSFHPSASKIIGKGMNSEKKKDLIYKIGEVWKDVHIEAGYIVGLPGEDSNSVKEVIDWSLLSDNPIYQLHLNPLRINPQHPGLPNTSRSDIDLNYEKYGYDIPNLEKFWEWTKDDGTDIRSFTDALRLSDSLTKKVESENLKTKKEVSTSNITDPQTEYFDLLIEQLKK
jgi:radical SAM superfamily enzyme YgiQ (UPF0313 family)